MAATEIATMRDAILSYSLRERALVGGDEDGLLTAAAQRIDAHSERIATLAAENEGLRVTAPRKRAKAKPKVTPNVAYLLKAKFASIHGAHDDSAIVYAWRRTMDEQRPIHGPLPEDGRALTHKPAPPNRAVPLLVHGTTIIHDERAAQKYLRGIGKGKA